MKKSSKFLPKLFLKNSNGFSLAEIMVAAGMLGVISLGVMQVMKNMQRGSKRMKQDFEAQTKVGELSRLLVDSNACRRTFKDAVMDGTLQDIPEILDKDGNSMLKPGDEIGGGDSAPVLLHVESIKVRGFFKGSEPIATRFSPNYFTAESVYDASGSIIPRRKGEAEVIVIFRKGQQKFNTTVGGVTTAERDKALKESSFGALSFTRKFSIQVLTDDANVITECYGNQDMYADAACSSLYGQVESGRCKNITIRNNETLTSPPAGAPTSQDKFALQAFGNVAINPASSTLDLTGTSNASAGSFGIGIKPNADSPSNFDIIGSAGIGAAPGASATASAVPISDTSTPGNLDVYNGVAIHGEGMDSTAAPGGMGLGVGVQDPPDGKGNLLVQNAMILGTNPAADFTKLNPAGATGDAQIRGSLLIGAEEDSLSLAPGEVRIQKGLKIGGSAASDPQSYLHTEYNADFATLAYFSIPTIDPSPTVKGDPRGRTIEIMKFNPPPAPLSVQADNSNFISKSDATKLAIHTKAKEIIRADLEMPNNGLIYSDVGELKITRDKDGSSASEPTNNIIIGKLAANAISGKDYPSIRIEGQDKDDIQVSGSKGKEVPTKEWVSFQIYGGAYTDAQKATIVGAITDYAQHHTLKSIQALICGASRVRNADKTSYAGGSWDGTTCTFNHINCTTSGHCDTIYANTGNITTINSTTGNISTVNATNINWSGTATGGQIVASRLRTTGVNWVANGVNASKICANGSCSTRFGRQVCPGNSIVKGIANGRVFCALNATTATQPVATDF